MALGRFAGGTGGRRSSPGEWGGYELHAGCPGSDTSAVPVREQNRQKRPLGPIRRPRLIARSSPLLVPAKHPERHTAPSGSGHRGPAAAYYTDQRRRSEGRKDEVLAYYGQDGEVEVPGV